MTRLTRKRLGWWPMVAAMAAVWLWPDASKHLYWTLGYIAGFGYSVWMHADAAPTETEGS